MSGALTFMNLGLSSVSVQRWLLIFPKAWLVAFPVVLVLAPVVRKITEKIASK
jgi:hypothetical protein